MVSLDPSVLDLVEAHPNEWVVRVDGRWSRWGLLYGTSPRWYFINEYGSWWHVTEFETDEDTRVNGTQRWDLEPLSIGDDDEPVRTGELVHVSHAPQEVQFWMAGIHVDVAECSELRERGGAQQNLSGWSA